MFYNNSWVFFFLRIQSVMCARDWLLRYIKVCLEDFLTSVCPLISWVCTSCAAWRVRRDWKCYTNNIWLPMSLRDENMPKDSPWGVSVSDLFLMKIEKLTWNLLYYILKLPNLYIFFNSKVTFYVCYILYKVCRQNFQKWVCKKK